MRSAINNNNGNFFQMQHDESTLSLAKASPAADADEATIGDLAREFDVTLRALRFYEARGLLTPRRSGLTRFYGATARARLALILKGKSLGFTLQEIREMLAAQEKQGDPKSHLVLSLEQVDEQLETLRHQQTEIAEAITELEQTRLRLVSQA